MAGEPNVKKYVDFCISTQKDEVIGYIASEPYQLYGTPPPGVEPNASVWLWAVDVEVDDQIVRGVPIATNNRDIYYAELGRSVTLKKINGQYVVVGLAKHKKGFARVVYMSFADDVVTITRTGWRGFVTRHLTYAELGEIPGEYGIFPYGAVGRFDAEGNFLELVTR